MVELIRHYVFDMWVSIYLAIIMSVQNLLQMNFQHHFTIQASVFFSCACRHDFLSSAFVIHFHLPDERINLYWAS